MLKPSFELSNFVAVPTSTTVGGTYYNEVFETTCNEVRFPEPLCNSKSPGSFRNHPLFAAPLSSL